MDVLYCLIPLLSLSATFLLIRYFYNRPPNWVVEMKNDLFDEHTTEDGRKYTKIDILIGRATQSLFASFRGAYLGERSGEVRLEKGLQGAMLDDVINSQNPIMGMIMEQFPQVKSYIMKHPQVLPQVLSMVGPLLRGKGLGVNPQSEYRSQF